METDEKVSVTLQQPNDQPQSNEYEDFHAFYHEVFNELADGIFLKKDDIIDYPILLQIFSVMHHSAPLGSTAYEVINDHLTELVDPLLEVLFGHNHIAGESMTKMEHEKG